MKCNAFASQLEAHVGQSTVRGGKAIKTDRKALNNLISRVKNIFSRKATTVTAAYPATEPHTDLSVVSDPRLKAALAAIEKYLGDNYGTPTAKLRYNDYANGASIVSDEAIFSVSLVVLTTPNGLYNLPDNVMLLGRVSSINDSKWLISELRKFTNVIMQLCPKHRIQHLAFAFDKTESDNPCFVKVNGLPLAQQEPDVTCLRLY